MSSMTAKDKHNREEKVLRLQRLQRMFTRLGYIAGIDTRAYMYRLHVWHLHKAVTIAQVEKILGERKAVTVRRHPEIGVWVDLPTQRA